MEKNSKSTGYSVLVTGGSGFLGKRIVEELLSMDSDLPVNRIVVFDLREYDGQQSEKVEFIKGDICNKVQLETALEGIDAVIHTAAIVDWGTKKPAEVYDVNFTGTEFLIDACKNSGVQAMIYTSSLDAVYTGRPLRNVDETTPYPESFANMYCQSKSQGEQLALQSARGDLKICALRPGDIWGEDDPYHIKAVIDMAKGGFYVRLGNGTSRCQHVYVGNCAHAHVLALSALLAGNEEINGEAYFVTDVEGTNFFKFFDQIVSGSGYRIWPRNLWLPHGLAYTFATLAEWTAFMLRPIKYYNPTFSRFAVDYTCTDFTFNSEKANRDFNYQVKYSLETAIQRTCDFYKENN